MGGLCRGDVGRAEHRDLLAARRCSPTLRTPQEQWVEYQGCQQKDNTLFAFRNDYSGFAWGNYAEREPIIVSYHCSRGRGEGSEPGVCGYRCKPHAVEERFGQEE